MNRPMVHNLWVTTQCLGHEGFGWVARMCHKSRRKINFCGEALLFVNETYRGKLCNTGMTSSLCLHYKHYKLFTNLSRQDQRSCGKAIIMLATIFHWHYNNKLGHGEGGGQCEWSSMGQSLMTKLNLQWCGVDLWSSLSVKKKMMDILKGTVYLLPGVHVWKCVSNYITTPPQMLELHFFAFWEANINLQNKV